MTVYTGKYVYVHPEHKKTVEIENNIQRVIAKVRDRHGPVIGDTSSMRHFTLAFGCTGNLDAIEKVINTSVPKLLKKHNKSSFTIRVQRYQFCPGPAPVVGVTPVRNSVDWNFFTELQATMLMDATVNAAHPDYVGDDKITDPSAFPAGFVDLKRDIDNGVPFDDAAHRWMWAHMSALQLNDKEIGTFNKLNRTAMVEKYGDIEMEPIDVVVSFRTIGVSVRDGDKRKLRAEIDVPEVQV